MRNPIKEAVLAARGAWACVDLLRNPTKLERVHDITTAIAATYPATLENMRRLFSREPQGAAALRERRRLYPDIAKLASLPPGSLGRAFAEHLRNNQIDGRQLSATGDRVRRPKVANAEEVMFIRAHIYDTHDVWHVLTGFGVDIAGELGLQAFCAAQTPYPLPSLLLGLGCLNTAMFGLDDTGRRMQAISRGWQMGLVARPLFGIDWDEHWSRPLAELQRAFEIEPYRDSLEGSARRDASRAHGAVEIGPTVTGAASSALSSANAL